MVLEFSTDFTKSSNEGFCPISKQHMNQGHFQFVFGKILGLCYSACVVNKGTLMMIMTSV